MTWQLRQTKNWASLLQPNNKNVLETALLHVSAIPVMCLKDKLVSVTILFLHKNISFKVCKGKFWYAIYLEIVVPKKTCLKTYFQQKEFNFSWLAKWLWKFTIVNVKKVVILKEDLQIIQIWSKLTRNYGFKRIKDRLEVINIKWTNKKGALSSFQCLQEKVYEMLPQRTKIFLRSVLPIIILARNWKLH